MRLIMLAVAATALLTGVLPAAAEYPERAITLVLPFGVHTGPAILPVTEAMAKELGQPITLSYQPGAGGTIATAKVIKEKPDGYTLVYVTAPNMVMSTRKHPPYDPLKSLDFVGFAHRQAPPVMISSAYKNIDELVAAAKKGVLNWSSTPNSTAYMAALQLLQIKGVKANFVPEAQVPKIQQELLGGTLQFASVLGSSVQGFVNSPKYRINALVQFAEKRSPFFPNVPTAAELGITEAVGFKDVTQIVGALAVPKGTPEAVLIKLRKALVKAKADPVVQQQMAKVFTLPLDGEADAVRDWATKNNRLWGEIFKDNHIPLK